MADGRRLYMFGFSDLTGMPENEAMMRKAPLTRSNIALSGAPGEQYAIFVEDDAASVRRSARPTPPR